MIVLPHHVELREGPDGLPAVEVTFHLAPEHVAAGLQALRSVRDGRYRTIELSVDEVLAMREITSLVDELTDASSADGVIPLRASVARLGAFSDAVNEFAAGEHLERGGDAAHRPSAYALADHLTDLRAEAVRAAFDACAPAP